MDLETRLTASLHEATSDVAATDTFWDGVTGHVHTQTRRRTWRTLSTVVVFALIAGFGVPRLVEAVRGGGDIGIVDRPPGLTDVRGVWQSLPTAGLEDLPEGRFVFVGAAADGTLVAVHAAGENATSGVFGPREVRVLWSSGDAWRVSPSWTFANAPQVVVVGGDVVVADLSTQQLDCGTCPTADPQVLAYDLRTEGWASHDLPTGVAGTFTWRVLAGPDGRVWFAGDLADDPGPSPHVAIQRLDTKSGAYAPADVLAEGRLDDAAITSAGRVALLTTDYGPEVDARWVRWFDAALAPVGAAVAVPLAETRRLVPTDDNVLLLQRTHGPPAGVPTAALRVTPEGATTPALLPAGEGDGTPFLGTATDLAGASYLLGGLPGDVGLRQLWRFSGEGWGSPAALPAALAGATLGRAGDALVAIGHAVAPGDRDAIRAFAMLPSRTVAEPSPSPSPSVGAPSDGWTSSPPMPLEGRSGHSVTAVDGALVVWGGYAEGGGFLGSSVLEDGAIYDLAADTWRPMSNGPLSGRGAHLALPLPGRVAILGGSLNGDLLLQFRDGAIYDLAADAWTLLPESPFDLGSARAGVAADGRIVVVGGGRADEGYTRVAILDPIARTWTEVPGLPLDVPTCTGPPCDAVPRDPVQVVLDPVQPVAFLIAASVDGADAEAVRLDLGDLTWGPVEPIPVALGGGFQQLSLVAWDASAGTAMRCVDFAPPEPDDPDPPVSGCDEVSMGARPAVSDGYWVAVRETTFPVPGGAPSHAWNVYSCDCDEEPLGSDVSLAGVDQFVPVLLAPARRRADGTLAPLEFLRPRKGGGQLLQPPGPPQPRFAGWGTELVGSVDMTIEGATSTVVDGVVYVLGGWYLEPGNDTPAPPSTPNLTVWRHRLPR